MLQPDPEVMPLAIQAFEKYGRREAFPFSYWIDDLVQTEATLDWAIRELHQQKDHAYCLHLSRLFAKADPQLLAPRKEAILKAPGFAVELVPGLLEHLQLLNWDADQCWKELEKIAEEGKNEVHIEKVDFSHAERVVKALARQGEDHAGRFLELLRQKVDYEKDDPMIWLEIFLVMLAGEMRLKPAIPLIVAKLHDFGDVLAEESVTALAKIGTDQAAIALSEGFLQEGWDYRLFASGAFESIRADATVEKCLELMPQEKELAVKTNLAHGVLANFAFEGIEAVRQLVLERNYDPQMLDLPKQLVASATIMGVTFPEYDQWKKEAEKRQARQNHRMKEMEQLVQEPPIVDKKPQPFIRTETTAGRNDLCPCGSGKKYKKCCLNKPKGLFI